MQSVLCRALASCLAAVVLASCTEKPRPEWPGGKAEVDTLKVREGVVTIQPAVANKTKVSKDTLTFPAEMASEVMANWPAGKVLLGNPATDVEAKRDNPFGFLRKVKSVEVVGNEVVVQTEPAALGDAVTGDFHTEVDLAKWADVELPPGTDLSAYRRPYTSANGTPFPEGPDDAGSQQQPLGGEPMNKQFMVKRRVEALEVVGDALEIPANVRIPLLGYDNRNLPGLYGANALGAFLKGGVTFSPIGKVRPRLLVDFSASLTKGVTSADFVVGGDIELGGKVDANFSFTPDSNASEAVRQRGLDFLKNVPLTIGVEYDAPLYEKKKYGSIGSVPVVATMGIYVGCKVSAGGGGHARAEAVGRWSPSFGVKYRKSDNPRVTKVLSSNVPTPAVNAELVRVDDGYVSVDCGLSFRVDLMVAGVAGPYAQVRGALVAKAQSTTTPCPAQDPAPKDHRPDATWKLGVKPHFEAEVGVEFSVFELATFTIGPFELWSKEFNDLWSREVSRPGAGRGAICQVQCDDQQKNGDESDVDCGGLNCARCVRNQVCTAGPDCLSGACRVDGRCVGSFCEDGVKDQQETDIDCGGPTCPFCPFRFEPGPTCAVDSDCGDSFCSNDAVTPKRCTRNLCRDGIVSATESDVDCGASDGCTTMCAVGKRCNTAYDCASGACHALTGLCVADTCVDGARTGNESDVDCGGNCSTKCALAQQCNHVARGNADCASGVCSSAGRCVTNTCENLRLDSNEVGVDCGGACAAKCPVGSSCRAGQNDCVAGVVCNTTTLRCEPPGCGDGIRNGQESGIDCGGPMCLKCGLSKACNAATDCSSNFCSGGRCVGSACENGVKEATEADVDCGGSCSVACATGATCTQPRDCASNLCVGNRCISDACRDRVRNGAETDVDCGGGVCSARCVGGQRCTANGDCQSSLCNLAQQRCAAGPCDDGLLTAGSESDVDCGGTCGATDPGKRCAVNKRCAAASDCASNVCNATTLRCVSSACFDGVRNGSETDVDCGGSCEPKCAATRLCTTNTDCQSGSCNAQGRCASDQCSDGRLNGNETGVDCGGQCATKCAIGQGCLSGTDCVHPMMLQGVPGFCVASTCSTSSCTSGAKDGDETGVDCGGPTCSARCAVGQGCGSNADCTGGICNTTTRVCVASRCQNGVRDQDETDIDCGGETCTSNTCATGQACTRGVHCTSGYCGTTNLCIPRIPESCAEVFNNNPSATSGMYVIDPDGALRRGSGTSGWNLPFSTYCLMDTAPATRGGWTPVYYANSSNSVAEPLFSRYLRSGADIIFPEECSTTTNSTCAGSSPGNTCQHDNGSGACTSSSIGSCHCTGNGLWSLTGRAPSLHGNPINYSVAGVPSNDSTSFNIQVLGNQGIFSGLNWRWQAFRGGTLVFDSQLMRILPPQSAVFWAGNGQWGVDSRTGGAFDYCAETSNHTPEAIPNAQSALLTFPLNNSPSNAGQPFAARDGWCRRFGRNMARALFQTNQSLATDVAINWVHRVIPATANGEVSVRTTPWVGMWFGSYGDTSNIYGWSSDVGSSFNSVYPPPFGGTTMGICNGVGMGTTPAQRATECAAYAHSSTVSFSYGVGETTDITKGSQFLPGVPGLVFVLWLQ